MDIFARFGKPVTAERTRYPRQSNRVITWTLAAQGQWLSLNDQMTSNVNPTTKIPSCGDVTIKIKLSVLCNHTCNHVHPNNGDVVQSVRVIRERPIRG